MSKTHSIDPEPIDPEPVEHQSREEWRADARTEIENLMYRYAEAIKYELKED